MRTETREALELWLKDNPVLGQNAYGKTVPTVDHHNQPIALIAAMVERALEDDE